MIENQLVSNTSSSSSSSAGLKTEEPQAPIVAKNPKSMNEAMSLLDRMDKQFRAYVGQANTI
ncbi:hypothetical protein DFA_10806 [Cavenderia fasciculata]|uniref:Uncharacterized protein n=1 Tax=Cavenderia fasciculata TaxID=261658 RepID=F4QBG0_CACFS|nr:uncharacterized protein DFA_10806 [Cavenderia fasciculata]EGG14932.1 hypothetical protein DFA_10806 [Cavenderia fasciculata]|eukprot:XP_004351448.1 hypothetical protein DFA_10806 [Cavenderia fasciculata]